MVGQQLPLAKFKAGQVSAAIWENEVQMPRGTVKILKATIQRRYKDRNGQWQSSGSFSRNEIPLAVHCLQRAFERIIDIQNEEGGSDGNVEEIAL
jgi:hypothetical protein